MADYKLNFTGDQINDKLAMIDELALALKDGIPTTTEQLKNNSGFITANDASSIISNLLKDFSFVTVNLD